MVEKNIPVLLKGQLKKRSFSASLRKLIRASASISGVLKMIDLAWHPERERGDPFSKLKSVILNLAKDDGNWERGGGKRFLAPKLHLGAPLDPAKLHFAHSGPHPHP
jgi:hypothetical protein